MSRVVRAIGGGTAFVAGGAVQYLIFEEAKGDIRKYLDTVSRLIWSGLLPASTISALGSGS